MIQTMNTLSRQRLQQLAEESTALYHWTMVRDFALQMYGTSAVKVRVEVYAQYNDETYDYPIGALIAYDANDKELAPDSSLPFFQTDAWKRLSAKGYCDEDDDLVDMPEDLSMSDEERQRGDWLLLEDLPAATAGEECSETFDLTVIPSIALPIV